MRVRLRRMRGRLSPPWNGKAGWQVYQGEIEEDEGEIESPMEWQPRVARPVSCTQVGRPTDREVYSLATAGAKKKN